jgi:hypothetical protein
LTRLWGVDPAAAAAGSVSNTQLQDQYITRFCAQHRGADQCNEFRANHTNWTSDNYLNFYRRHQDDKSFATPAAAELFGIRAKGH